MQSREELLLLPTAESSFLKLGFDLASQLAGNAAIGPPLYVARCSVELPGMFADWAGHKRLPLYSSDCGHGLRVDKMHPAAAALLSERALPSFWLVLSREPTREEVCSFCCVWVTLDCPWVFAENFEQWHSSAQPLSRWDSVRMAAYSQFTSSPALLTTSAVAELGLFVWTPVLDLLRVAKRCAPTAVKQFDDFLQCLHRDDRAGAGAIMDSGSLFQKRTLVHKRRHHFDLASVVACAARTWTSRDNPAATDLFWKAVSTFVFETALYNWRYERVLFTFCQLFGDKYWPSKLAMYLEHDMLSLGDAEWLSVCKLITTFAARSFCIPFTNHRHEGCFTFMYLHYTLGWACDMDVVDMKDTIMSVIGAKLQHNLYSADGSEERYYKLFEDGVRRLVQPLVARFAQKMLPWDEFSRQYGGGLSTGSSGRRVRELFGKDKVPTGSTRSYVAARLEREDWHSHPPDVYTELNVKFNEKAEQRHIMARDFMHHAREKWFWQLVANRGALHGADIGESPMEEVLRKFCMSQETLRGGLEPSNGFTLLDADYAKFDENVEGREKLIMQDVMFQALRKHAPAHCQDDVEKIGPFMIQTELAQILRTSHLTEPEVRKNVDAIVQQHSGVEWVNPNSLKIVGGNSQDSGTYWTLEGNTYISRGRMHIRDSLMCDDDRPIRSFNRSDDITESYNTWVSAKRSYDTFALLGLLFKEEKQRACHYSRVYFRDMYVSGAILGAPGRAIHSLMSSKPADKPTPVLELNKLAAISEACSRAVRRGMEGAFVMHLYNDAENFFRKIRVKLGRPGRFKDVYVAKSAIRAPREQGGYGIQQPWKLFYDWERACGKRILGGGADARMQSMAVARMLPGAVDFAVLCKDRLERASGMQVSSVALGKFLLRNKIDKLSGDGSGQMQVLLAERMRERMPGPAHRVVAHKPYVEMVVRARLLFMQMVEALGMERLMRDAARVMHDGDPPVAKGAIVVQFGGLALECLHNARNADERRDVLRGFLGATITGQTFLEQGRLWPPERVEAWLLGGWPTGFNTRAVPPMAIMLVKRLQDVYMAEQAPKRHSRRAWLLHCVAAAEAALSALLELEPRLFLH